MKSNLTNMSVSALVERFMTLGLGQYQAEDDIAKKNKLLREMWKVIETSNRNCSRATSYQAFP